MFWRRRFTSAAALSVLEIMGALPGSHVTDRGSEQNFVENLVLVPVVAGEDEKDSIAAIEAAGLRPKITYRRFPGRHGRVIAQQIPNSRLASRGDPVSIVVGAAKTLRSAYYFPFR